METIDFLTHVEKLEIDLRNESANYEDAELSPVQWDEINKNKEKAIHALKNLIWQLELI